MGDIKFWKLAYQLFKPDEPLTKDELRDFYVRRDDSPVDGLVNLLAMDDTAAKFLLAGHRGGGKTTELRRLEQSQSIVGSIWDSPLWVLDFSIFKDFMYT